MKMRLTIVVVFLIAMTAGVADAEWEWWYAEPQPFQVFDDYVIAVGAKGKLEPVQASDIKKALRDGKEIRLKDAEIQGDLRFRGEGKQNVYFGNTTFTGYAEFISATFTGDASFESAKFKETADFRNASLKNILYDEVFYLTLIKKYEEQGWLNQADYAYYDYRQKKRRNRNILYGEAELFFLEIPFGYGVKPWILLRSFLCLWIPFSLYYLGFLRRPEDNFLHRIGPWNPFRNKCRCLFWAVIHSLNILTPGVDLQSMRFVEASQYELVEPKSKRLVWIQRVQHIIGWYLLALFLVMFGKIWVR